MSSLVALPADYEVESELGRGAMGTVYLANQVRLGRPVAVKILNATSDPEVVARFEREAKTLAQLNHPNIVKVIDYGVAEGSPYIVMDYITGETLDNLIRSRRPTVDEALSILRQLAAALEHAHSRGVIHRDVKPANIICQGDGQVLLTDFGIAKSSFGSGLTQIGATMGTPCYMAPELCRGGEAFSSSDTYSLGVLAYELITGRRPFDGPPDSVMYQHIHECAPDPCLFFPGISSSIRLALLHGLEKDPGKRYPRPSILVTALESAIRAAASSLASNPASYLSSAQTTALTPENHKRRVRVGLTIAAVAALLGVAVLGVLLKSQGSQSTSFTDPGVPKVTVGALKPPTPNGSDAAGTVGNAIAPKQPNPPPVSPPAQGVAANLKGPWTGAFGRKPAQLVIESVSGVTFTGYIRRQKEIGESFVAVSGYVDSDGRTVRFSEDRIITLPPGDKWTLGNDTAVYDASNGTLSGTSVDNVNKPFGFSFTRGGTLSPLFTEGGQIRQVIEVWRNARINKNMADYLACYSFPVDYKGAAFSQDQLLNREQSLFTKHNQIQITIGKISVVGEGSTARATFPQHYTAVDAAMGQAINLPGVKTLRFQKQNGAWKIVWESS